MERMSAEAARRTIPEFAKLDQVSSQLSSQQTVKRHITATEERLPNARAIQENIEVAKASRMERERQAEVTRQSEALDVLRSTLPNVSQSESPTAESPK
jgi:uncharacterized protein YaiL (DUF2058 family)